MGIIQAICISEVRGVQKHAIPEADLTPEWGIVGDTGRSACWGWKK